MPQVSIIIPSYGQARYLGQAIESALCQTISCEIIVVDDGSTDGSLAVAQQFIPQVKVIRQINKGLAAARNTGIMNAQGDWLYFLDADDFLATDAIETLLHLAIKESADIAAPSLRCFNDDGFQDRIIMPNPTLADYQHGNRCPYACLFKKSVLLEVGGYSPRYDALGGWEDLALMYDMLTRGKKLVTTPAILLQYRIKENSMWKDAEKNKDKLWDQIIKDFPEVATHRK